jgi:hypothetical protein
MESTPKRLAILVVGLALALAWPAIGCGEDEAEEAGQAAEEAGEEAGEAVEKADKAVGGKE